MGETTLDYNYKRKREKVTFDNKEIKLILSALSNDSVGKWGDERSAGIEKLINKIKREGE